MEIFDTTLRDGTQSANINLSIRDKVEIVRALDEFGIDYIELGWPGSNPKDMETFLEVTKLKLNNSKVVAFGSTRRKGIKASEDANLNAILDSKARVACIFGKTWLAHVEKQLKIKPEENLGAINDSIKFLKSKGLEVVYDLEHFFDGFMDNKKYALECLKQAVLAGSDYAVMCDTNGGTLVKDVEKVIQEVNNFLTQEKLKVKLGVHFHNDSGVAVANSLVSVDYGIEMIQGTINGFGERAGNADLCQIIPNLILKKGVKTNKIKLKKLTELSDITFTLANIKPNKAQPFVGKHAFLHKGGIHVDAIMKGASYEHVDATSVGNERGIVLSDLSGKANIVEALKKFGIKVDKNDSNVKKMLSKVEVLEKEGYDIGSLPAEQFLLKEEFFGKGEVFKINSWEIHSEQKNGEFSECTVIGKIKEKDIEVKDSVKGGPVDAVYHTIKKLAAKVDKNIEKLKLINYKVMIAEDKGAESSVRVYIEFKKGNDEWGTVGVSTNILEASIEAIEKGLRYYLLINAL